MANLCVLHGIVALIVRGGLREFLRWLLGRTLQRMRSLAVDGDVWDNSQGGGHRLARVGWQLHWWLLLRPVWLMQVILGQRRLGKRRVSLVK